MTRRHADVVDPCPGLARDTLTSAQRIAVQTYYVDRFLGTLERVEWDRRYRRDRQTHQPQRRHPYG